MPSVQQGLGGGRYTVRSRHGQKGGGRCGARCSSHGRGILFQWRDHRSRVGLRDAEPLGQSREGAGRGIAEGAQRRQQRRQEDMTPLIRFALDHPEQAPMDNLECIGFQVDQDEEQPIFRRR